MSVGPARIRVVFAVRYNVVLREARLSFRRLLRIAPLPFGAAAMMCTPFKEDTPRGRDGSSNELANLGPPCDASMPFDPPVVVPGFANINGTLVDGLRLSADYRSAYFHASGRPDSIGHNDLYIATRPSTGAPFVDVMPIAGGGIETPDDELYPTVSGDGLVLVFARGGPTADPVHLYSAMRQITSVNFTGVKLLSDVNVQSDSDSFPFLREDGKVLYYASGAGDIYRSEATGAGIDPTFGMPTAVGELNTSFSELGPIVTPDDLTIYYASDRTDGGARGTYDIWMATRMSASDTFSAPTNVTDINTRAFELPTFVTRDGCTLYFSSTRDGALLPYVTTRRRRDN